MKRVSIIGSGWLAKPLYHALQNNTAVTLSTTDIEKCKELTQQGYNVERVELSSDGIKGPISFFECDVLILAIPPRSGPDGTSRQFRSLLSFLREHQLGPHILMASSTSVFAKDQGDVSENTRPTSNLANGSELILGEQVILSEHNSIIRFAGLVGPGRHPGRFLAGRVDVAHPQAPINLIHLDDAVGILKSIIEKESWGEIFHGVCPDHRPRVEFYTAAALSLGLPPPRFALANEQRAVRVLTRKLQYLLNYEFIHPRLDEFLSSS